jgi:N-methylhydantoinase A/oxoprolinase/acetone carboxylase beta subunit
LILIAVDIGGTFTDVVAVDSRSGAYHTAKVPTTPQSLVEGVRLGTLAALDRASVRPDEVERFVHGTTIGTNAILERRGATTAVLATEGFEDSLEIGRLKRTKMYDVFMDAETPVFLAPRRRRRGIPGRIASDGSVVTPLDENAVREVVRELRDEEGATAFAVSLLFSFRNSDHERRVRELIQDFDASISVSLSSEIDPMFREYERTVVTAFDAYIRPVIQQYVENLRQELRRTGKADLGAALRPCRGRHRRSVRRGAVGLQRPHHHRRRGHERGHQSDQRWQTVGDERRDDRHLSAPGAHGGRGHDRRRRRQRRLGRPGGQLPGGTALRRG